MTSPSLNAGQQAAADACFQFLFDDRKELNISGPGGVGKTFLMSYIIDTVIPRYHETCKMMGIEPRYPEFAVTATTNKAASVLSRATKQDAGTIHSFLGVKPKEDFKTGKSTLVKTNQWKVHENMILFVDEASMIDSELYYLIHAAMHNSKIVYLGDHCQLAPVMERISPVYRNNIEMAELTQPMRNAEQPALIEVCNQLRTTVETGEFHPIKIIPGVIDHADDWMMENEIAQAFEEQTFDSRILAYTNKRVMDYNEHIRELRKLPSEYVPGENLINNSAIQLEQTMMHGEQEFTLCSLSNETETVALPHDGKLEVKSAIIVARGGVKGLKVKLPVDRDHFQDLIKFYGRMKDFQTYFDLKNTYPDLRPADACTVYKAQGSTYDTVFIDLADISTCTNPRQAARMLYVAFSRAKSRIVLYGQLADRFGGLTH